MQKVVMSMMAGLVAAMVTNGVAPSVGDGQPSKPVPHVRAAATTNVKQVSATLPAPKTYTVVQGDSLSSIAQAQGLSSWLDLWDANPVLTDPDDINPGQQLILPTGPVSDRPLPAGYDAPPVASAQEPVTLSSTSVASAPAPNYNYAAGVGGLLARVRQRESGGNYAEDTGNGFYGAYQFTLSTWEGVGGSGLPSDASPAEQDMRAQMLYSERGCSPWPNTCY